MRSHSVAIRPTVSQILRVRYYSSLWRPSAYYGGIIIENEIWPVIDGAALVFES